VEANMTRAVRSVLGFALAILAAVGCGVAADPADMQVATDGAEALSATSQSISLANVVFDEVSVGDPVKAAAQLGMPGQLWPVGCVTRARDAADPEVVHVTLNDCTGPFGLVHIDGGERVTLSLGAMGTLHVAIVGESLTANGRPVTFSASADVTFPSLTTRSVVWQGSWTRVDDAGETLTHTSDLQITVDLTANCRTSNGSATTTVATRKVDTTFTGYKLCRDAASGAEGCPSGTVTHIARPSGRTVTVAFDDSSVAAVTGPRGNTFSVDLTCTSIGR
jgi:hypothetical protein